MQAGRMVGRQGEEGRWCVSAADWLTIGNGLCGLFAVVSAFGGFGEAGGGGLGHGRLVTCAALIAAGSVLDVADGAVAHLRGSSGMGDALDSMSDVLTFGAAPAALLIAAGGSQPQPWRSIVALTAVLFLAAAMLRLARSHTSAAPAAGGFYGLTTPAAAGAILALLFLRPSMGPLCIGVVVVSWLSVSDIRYPHQDRRTIPLLCGYWALATAGLAGWLPMWPAAVIWLVCVPAIPLLANGAHRLAASRLAGAAGGRGGLRAPGGPLAARGRRNLA